VFVRVRNRWARMAYVFLLNMSTPATLRRLPCECLVHRLADSSDFEFCWLGGVGVQRASGLAGFEFETLRVQRFERSAGVERVQVLQIQWRRFMWINA
jgi:hypothetical protein